LQKKLVVTQDADIKKYLTAQGITNAVKTASGLYVAIDNPGNGDLVKPLDLISMNYDGKLLNGEKFDSNTDTAFNHVTPFSFTVGKGQVIAGWDEGVKQLRPGAKAKFIIPSGLAYGANAQAKIPANSILRFDVEVMDVKDPAKMAAAEDATIQDFLKTNNITNAVKTKSGMYYVVTKEGNGVKPMNGDNVTMNYTGMFLDGKKFDSNEDSTFNHVSPFEFPLGQRRVIAGWDEGVALLSKGAKAKLIIPSPMAYGASGQGNIPANSILQFDVELVDFKKTPPPVPQGAPVPVPINISK
jgi:FKBP-type peptidyl-prolyl cis-trans isomerase